MRNLKSIQISQSVNCVRYGPIRSKDVLKPPFFPWLYFLPSLSLSCHITMDIQRQFPAVHWIWGGGISTVYEVHPRIVVKVPQSGEFERGQFAKEIEIYRTFSQHPPCPSIVQCFLYTHNGIFLEYMRGTIRHPF